MIINLSNIILKVNIQIRKHFDLNEYFIAIGINVQCLYTIMALGHIYTNKKVIGKLWCLKLEVTHLGGLSIDSRVELISIPL